MTLPTSVYTANRGYSWSSAPEGIPTSRLDLLHRYISNVRGDFPDPLSVEVGVVSDGKIAAAFTIQNVDGWDSEHRACDYAAFAFFPVGEAANIDFIDLVNNDFFWTPSREPLTSIDYTGGPSQKVSQQDVLHLAMHRECLLKNPRAVGDLFFRYGNRSAQWVCLMKAENILKIICNSWN